MTAERLLSTRRVYEGRVVTLRVDDVELDGGGRAVREIVEHRGAAAIIPLVGGDVLLVRQFRAAAGRALLEIPAGTIEPGETADACARRELAEEVGMRAGRLRHLLTFYPSPGFLTEAVYLYVAEDLTPHRAVLGRDGVEAVAHEEEDLAVVRLPLARVREMVRRGEIVDAKSIIGLLVLTDQPPDGGPR